MPTVAELLTPTFAAEPASLHSGASIGGAGQGVGGAGGGAAHSWVEPLDAASFSAFLPPPYRVLLLLALGILCFGSNLHGLHLLGLDPWPLLRPLPPLPAPSHSHLHTHTHARAPSTGTWSSARAHISSIYQVGALALSWALCGWASYRYYVDGPSQGDPAGRHAQTVQGIAVFGVLAAALWPGNLFHRPLRAAFGRALRRILSPSLHQRITFADVLIADILTSFAKVLGDVWLTACFLVPRANHHVWWNGRGSFAVPLLTSLPYAIRLRQCLSEYNLSAAPFTLAGNGAHTRSKRPLFNALKYASAFPVIWLSALQGREGLGQPEAGGSGGAGGSFVFGAWLLAVFVNSLFSFWWDVTNDWGLELLRPHTLASTPAVVADSVRSLHLRGASLGAVFSLSSQSEHKTSLHPHHHNHNGQSIHHPSSPSLKVGSSALAPSTSRHRRQPTALRPPQVGMLFPPSVYRGAILADLLLRFLWSLKLSSHLHHVVELETGVFALEALEIIRRWAWVFLRVEWEAVKTSRGVGMGNGDIDEEDGRQTVGLEPIQ